MATQRELNLYANHPMWNGQIYIPFLRSSLGVSVIEGSLQFCYHGMHYSINLNQKATIHADGSVLVAVARKPKFRTKRKPIGLPSHTSLYFITHEGRSLSMRDVDTWNGYYQRPTTISQAFATALA